MTELCSSKAASTVTFPTWLIAFVEILEMLGLTTSLDAWLGYFEHRSIPSEQLNSSPMLSMVSIDLKKAVKIYYRAQWTVRAWPITQQLR